MSCHNPMTCLSDRPHDQRISDPAIHFNGCLRASKRANFYKRLPVESQARIARVNQKVAELRHRLETTEQESTAGDALRRFQQSLAQWRNASGRPQDLTAVPAQAAAAVQHEQDGFLNHIKAPVMYIRAGEAIDHPDLAGAFPHQKVSMADLLSGDASRNPIMQPCEDNVVRYFHLPANNMTWVEQVIARYYREEQPDSNNAFLNSRSRRPTTKTEMLLRPEFWQGQQNYEIDSEIHARHMRPFCSGISVDPASAEPTNLALFMPYLHWETDRGRCKAAQIAKQVGQENISVSEVVRQARQQFSQGHTETQDTLVPSWTAPEPEIAPQSVVGRKRALGHLLTAAAALMEAMDMHTEELLMTNYLHSQPPLHPRRTLDQAYYGALRSTTSRDRDQVVYRGTTAEPHECLGMEVCQQCKEDVRKTPRIIMVDQLWMWVLDEQTVITSFPRRWGRNRPDTSAIHKSLRQRLKYSRGEILSAYDLAFAIVDETTRVFFDRAKLSKRQPNLTELFAGAIRDLTYKQTAAFDQFLIYTHLASRDYRRQRYGSSDNSTQNHLLNINPEGELLKEAKDIMDELHIMMRIKEQQQTVMEHLVKHVQRRGPRLGQSRDGTGSANIFVFDNESSSRRLLTRGDNLLAEHSSRIAELHALLQNAQLTSGALKDLLTLKQQQASVIEAREAVKQAQLTLKQGQSIMIFTIVTIIFLPLSFFVGLFGMNSIEFNDGLLSLSTEFTYMFPISAGIILISFLFAFSQSVTTNSVVMLVRSSCSFAWNTAVTWTLIKTGMYVAGREMASKASQLRAREAKITGAMKAEVLRKEKNLEKLKAAGHVKELMKRKTDLGAMMSPYSASGMLTPGTPGTPRPLMMEQHGAKGPSLGVRVGEVDVELGEMERKPSSQRYLVPGMGGGR
ncbi:magnesium transport protein cora [Cladorrhinum samala]|uniref:Magnesium transport protein cora n=1 Tax=Cladorrhinum samala TaxID=585594 RepID=A0AAV9HW40_9PEZI|nr:magnesium transport protein cora [Cladorrhinum samala]